MAVPIAVLVHAMYLVPQTVTLDARLPVVNLVTDVPIVVILTVLIHVVVVVLVPLLLV